MSPPAEAAAPEVSSRRDPIRHDPVRTAVEVLPALYGHGGAPRPGHPSPAGVQEVLQVHHLRLPGGVGDHRDALRPAGGQHQILRGPHGWHPQHHFPAPQPVRPAVEEAALLPDLRPQVPQARKVEVDRPGAQLAPAGVAQVRLPAPGQDRPQENGGGAHLPHEYIRNLTAAQGGGVHRQGIRLPMGVAAQMPQDADGGVHIPQPGAAQQRHLPPCQQRGRQNGQDAVLGPLDRDLSLQAGGRLAPTKAGSYPFPSESRMVQQSILWPAGFRGYWQISSTV